MVSPVIDLHMFEVAKQYAVSMKIHFAFMAAAPRCEQGREFLSA